MFQTITTRRQFLVLSAAAVAVGATMPRLASAQATTIPQLTETDATAAALGYKHDTTKVDAAKYPNHKPSQICANCKLVQGAEADAWRPCSIFPGKSVNAKGWCAAYAAKA